MNEGDGPKRDHNYGGSHNLVRPVTRIHDNVGSDHTCVSPVLTVRSGDGKTGRRLKPVVVRVLPHGHHTTPTTPVGPRT